MFVIIFHLVVLYFIANGFKRKNTIYWFSYSKNAENFEVLTATGTFHQVYKHFISLNSALSDASLSGIL